MAKNLSEVEDGFALKHQRENAKRGKKPKVKGDYTILPRPVKHILSSYTMSNPISKRAISDVETQARDEKVQHAERLMSEHVVGHDYNCWDVHSGKDSREGTKGIWQSGCGRFRRHCARLRCAKGKARLRAIHASAPCFLHCLTPKSYPLMPRALKVTMYSPTLKSSFGVTMKMPSAIVLMVMSGIRSLLSPALNVNIFPPLEIWSSR